MGWTVSHYDLCRWIKRHSDDSGGTDLLDFADGLVPEPVEGEEDEEEAESGSEMDDGGSQEFSSEAGSVVS